MKEKEVKELYCNIYNSFNLLVLWLCLLLLFIEVILNDEYEWWSVKVGVFGWIVLLRVEVCWLWLFCFLYVYSFFCKIFNVCDKCFIII